MNLPQLALTHRTRLVTLCLALVLLGLAALAHRAGRDEVDARPHRGQVVVRWPGASAEQVAAALLRPLEARLRPQPDLELLTGVARSGLAALDLGLAPTTADPRRAWDDVRARVASVDLPEGASAPEVFARPAPDVRLAVFHTPTESAAPIGRVELRGWAQVYADVLRALPEVAHVVVTPEDARALTPRHGGAEAALLELTLAPGASWSALERGVDGALRDAAGRVPAGLQCVRFANRARYAKAQVAAAQRRGVLGAALALLVLGVWAGWRAAWVAAASIPLTVLVALSIAPTSTGIGSHTVAATALALAWVSAHAGWVTESTRAAWRPTTSRFDATLRGVRAARAPLTWTSVTALGVFLAAALTLPPPWPLVAGVASAVIVASVVASFALTPTLAHDLVRRETPLGLRVLEPLVGGLDHALRRPRAVLVAGAVALTAGWVGATVFGPQSDHPAAGDRFLVDLRLPPRADRALAISEVEDLLLRASADTDEPRLRLAVAIAHPAGGHVRWWVDPLGGAGTLRAAIREGAAKLPGCLVEVAPAPAEPGAAAPTVEVRLQVTGVEARQLAELGRVTVEALRDHPDLEHARSDWGRGHGPGPLSVQVHHAGVPTLELGARPRAGTSSARAAEALAQVAREAAQELGVTPRFKRADPPSLSWTAWGGFLALAVSWLVLTCAWRYESGGPIVWSAASLPWVFMGALWGVGLSGWGRGLSGWVGATTASAVVLPSVCAWIDAAQARAAETSRRDAALDALRARSGAALGWPLVAIAAALPWTLGGGWTWSPWAWAHVGGIVAGSAWALVVLPALWIWWGEPSADDGPSIEELKGVTGLFPMEVPEKLAASDDALQIEFASSEGMIASEDELSFEMTSEMGRVFASQQSSQELASAASGVLPSAEATPPSEVAPSPDPRASGEHAPATPAPEPEASASPTPPAPTPSSPDASDPGASNEREPASSAVEPVAEEPVAEEPVSDAPVPEASSPEEPVAEEPTASEPASEEQVPEEPAPEEPAPEGPAPEGPGPQEQVRVERDPTPDPGLVSDWGSAEEEALQEERAQLRREREGRPPEAPEA